MPRRFASAILLCLAGTSCAPPPPALPPVDSALYPQATLLSSLADRGKGFAEVASFDLGEPAARPHLGEGWLWPETLEDGTSFVWAAGEASELNVRLTAPRKLRLTGTGWPYRPPDGGAQHMTLVVNGREVGDWRMRPGTHSSGLEIPASAFEVGMNRLELRPRVRRSEAGEPEISAAWDRIDLSPVQTEAPSWRDSDLHLPWGSGLHLYLDIAGPTVLAFDALDGDGDARLRFELATDAAPQAPPLAVIAPQATPGSLEIRPAETSGEPVLVRLTLAAFHPRQTDGVLVLRRPSLRHTAPTAKAPAATAPPIARWRPEAPGDQRPNVLLYLVDTLRADRLGCYGGDPAVSPRIDAFAADSILFERTTAQSSWTRASMASILTGYGADRHGVETRLDALPPEAVTLAELLSANGYATAGILTNGNAGEDFGFAQGFDEFELLPEVERGVPSGAEPVHAGALRLLDGPLADRTRPFFLYLHTMEPHAPYVIPEPLPGDLQAQRLPDSVVETLRERGAYTEGPTDYGSVAWVQALFHRLLEADLDTGQKMGLAYDAAIAHNDRLFGELLDELRRRGLLEDTVVIFLSDHGEELFDHGSWSHGLTLYEEQLRVPFILHLPGKDAPRGLRSSARALQVDLLPTLLDYLSLAAPPGLDGSSLLERLGTGVEPRPASSHLDLDGRRLAVWLEDPLKLICPQEGPCALFDLVADPGEKQDLAATLPITTQYLRLRLDQRAEMSRALPAAKAELAPEMEEQLRALGYL